MGRLEGKVALISGAARGQGRSHAIRLAEEGADIIAFDVCDAVPSNSAPPATEEDLAETVRQVEALDRRVVSGVADVRDYGQVKAVADQGVSELGRLDIVSANAGIAGSPNVAEDIPDEEFVVMQEINLNGVWRTCRAAIPHLRESGEGGSIVITSSEAGIRGYQNMAHYVAAKHAVVGLMRTLALELAPDMIRVNSIHPTQVDTDMIQHQAVYELFTGKPNATREDFAEASQAVIALPIPWVEAVDISNALLFLSSEEGRYITGVTLPVDGGNFLK